MALGLGHSQVTLKLTFDNGSREFTVSSVMASIIARFGDCAEWTAQALAEDLGITQEALMRKMAFWVGQVRRLSKRLTHK